MAVRELNGNAIPQTTKPAVTVGRAPWGVRAKLQADQADVNRKVRYTASSLESMGTLF